MSHHSPLTPEQRTEVVLAALRKEESIDALCRRHNISDTTLMRWREEFLAGGKAALGDGKRQQSAQARRVAELEQELAERNQVIGELTVANRILKKTAGPG